MMNKEHSKDATKDVKDTKRAPKKLRCNGCNRPSDDIACPSCLASNGRKCERFGCNRNLPANGKYNYCKACSCTTRDCPNACVDGNAHCQRCIDAWNVTCFICSKRRATVSFQTCKPCDEARGMCEQCRRYKVSVDSDSKAFNKFCSRCLCKTCTNLHQKGSDYCETCEKCLCTKCGRGFTEMGSDVCVECTRKQTRPCGNPSCSGLAGFDMTSRTFYDFCKDCTCRGCGELNNGGEGRLCESCHACVALNCFRITPGPKHEYCAKCNDEYRSGRVKCIGKNCKLYTRKENGICGACTENGVAPVAIPRKADEPVSGKSSGPAKTSPTTTAASKPAAKPSATSKPSSLKAAAVPSAVTNAKPVVNAPTVPAPTKFEPLVNSQVALPSNTVAVKVPPPSLTMVVKGCATVVVIPSPDCTAEEFDAVSLAIRGLAESQENSSSPNTKGKVQWGDRCAA